MKKLNKKQKEHIKKVMLKALNIICYVLSAAFIMLMVIVGAQSCQQKRTSSVSAESLNNSNYSYQLRDVGVVAMTQSDFEHYNDLFELPNENVEDDYTLGYEVYFNFSLPNGTIYYNVTNDFYIEVYNLCYTFKVKSASTHVYYWRLDRLEVNDVDGNYHFLLNHYSNSANDYYLDYGEEDIYITSSIYFNDITGIDLFMMYNQVSRFSFNRDFNYNAPMGLTSESPYGAEVQGSTEVSGLYRTLSLDIGWFTSNGELYNKIVYRAMITDALSFQYGDGSIHLGPSGSAYFSYWCLEYWNTETNKVVIVNHRDQIAYMPTSNSYGYYQANSATWQVDNYRYINILGDLNDANRTSLERFNNNNQNTYSGNVVSGDINNIFTLIASAFTAWLPVMSVYLLPGITIGTLLFIPLVAMLVFAIIRIIKK